MPGCRMHDEVMEYITKILRPGMREYELQLMIIAKLLELGSEEQLVMIGSGPANVCAPIQYTHYQNRTIEKGDAVVIMVETSGCGGYYCEISRPYIVGGNPVPMVLSPEHLQKMEECISGSV